MKTIFDTETPRCKFESFMMKIQTVVLTSGFAFFAFILIRLIFNF